VIHYLFQAAMLKQDMLSCSQLVPAIAELVSNAEGGSSFSAILNTCIAVSCDADPHVERAVISQRESQVWRHYYVAGCGCHPYLDRPTIEREHQRQGATGAFACYDVQPTG
jgi:hypothetical protein